MTPYTLRTLVCLLLLSCMSGCPAPTPGERIEQLGAVVTEKGNGVVDLDLSGTNVHDDDMAYIGAFCSNDSRYQSVHTLDLSDTSVTDAAIDHMTLQSEFPAGGLQVLVIRNTKISDEAVSRFQQKFAECEVVR